jgi:hypothetical protein
MKKILIVIAVVGLAGGLAFGRKGRPLPAPNGIELPADFADWRIISTSVRSDNDTMRAILGNKTAVKAAREGRVNPWPDGAVLAKVAWRRASLPEWQPASVPGDFVQVEFMMKDSRKYAQTGGWGFARWVGNGLKPYGADAGFVNECFTCHQPVKARDYVFTRPAVLPSIP